MANGALWTSEDARPTETSGEVDLIGRTRGDARPTGPSRVLKNQKECHSEERSDEESFSFGTSRIEILHCVQNDRLFQHPARVDSYLSTIIFFIVLTLFPPESGSAMSW